MKIGIDAATMASGQPGGYRTYTTNLVQHLALMSDANDYFLLVDQPINWQPTAANWRLQTVSRQGSLGYIWREQVKLAAHAQKQGVDLLHFPAATGPVIPTLPFVVTTHDAIEFSERLPSPKQTRRWAMRLYSRYAQLRAAKVAQKIITVSNYSKEQIVKKFAVPSDKITVIHEAPSPHYSVMDKDKAADIARQKFGVENYLLAFASASPRKNIGRLLTAYASFSASRRSKHPLALVCTHEDTKKMLLEQMDLLGLAHEVVLLNNVSDDDLLVLYNAASLFVFPSLEEGFGLPPLEAMACGTPVVAANTSSLPEVLGEAALLVSPTDIEALADAMNQVLCQPAVSEMLAAKGLAQSQNFSWEKTARETLAVYESL